MPGAPFSSTAVLFALFVAMYAAFGVASPFWPRFFEMRGVSAQQIGLLLGCGTLAKLVSGPLLGRLADASNRPVLILATSTFLASTFAVLLILSGDFGLLLLLYILQAAALAPVTSIADAFALGSAPKGSFEYGRLRGVASGAFVVGTLAIGYIVGQTNIDAVAYGQAVLLLLAAALASLIRWDAPAYQSGQVVTAQVGVAELLCIPQFRRVVLLAALVYGSHAVHDAFAVIRWNSSGLEPALTAVLWSEAVAAEVVVFVFIGPLLIHRLGTHGAAALAAMMGVIRWVVMGSTTDAFAVAVVQPLHGFTFALTHLACMRVIGNVVPAGLSSTAQALYAFGGGLASVVLAVGAGPIFAAYGGGAFLPMALLCAIAVPIAWNGMRDVATRSE